MMRMADRHRQRIRRIRPRDLHPRKFIRFHAHQLDRQVDPALRDRLARPVHQRRPEPADIVRAPAHARRRPWAAAQLGAGLGVERTLAK